ncbi:MAG: hypothetical protein K2X86_01565 [Cytophagaceae bacterium]|nr:hypothetical protein [Cytophagaceae bacterium]
MRRTYTFFLLYLAAFTLSSCEVIGGIFKAGFWVGIITVGLIVGLIIFIMGKMRR